jgi:hypothetical protein
VISEVALSVMLLVGAGLMVRSFSHLISQNLGYNPEQVVSFDLGLPFKKYPTLAERARFFQQLKAKMDVVPGVQAAALVRGLPLSGQNSGGDVSIKGASRQIRRRSRLLTKPLSKSSSLARMSSGD